MSIGCGRLKIPWVGKSVGLGYLSTNCHLMVKTRLFSYPWKAVKIFKKKKEKKIIPEQCHSILIHISCMCNPFIIELIDSFTPFMILLSLNMICMYYNCNFTVRLENHCSRADKIHYSMNKLHSVRGGKNRRQWGGRQRGYVVAVVKNHRKHVELSSMNNGIKKKPVINSSNLQTSLYLAG